MTSVGLIHHDNYHDEIFRCKNDRRHLSGLFTSSATLANKKALLSMSVCNNL